MWKLLRGVFLVALTALATSTAAVARESVVYTGTFSSTAVGGYDPVAYFTENKPVKGNSKISTEYKGAKWYFASPENRDKFVAAPTLYEPQYGGYCAWAVSQGKTASGDPQFWKVVNNKLYLNYDADVQKKWEANIPDFIQKANANWPKVLE
jgi:YHS domain-containing protein